MDLKMRQINSFACILIAVVTAFVTTVDCRTWPYASAQLIEPKWNWEEVILSRNGPSTTPGPTTTTSYTTLRSVVGDNIQHIFGVGTASVEDAHLVPRNQRGKAVPLTTSPNSGGRNQLNFSAMLMASSLVLLMAAMKPIYLIY